MNDSNNRIDLVSGTKVPAEEIAVTPAMIEAGLAASKGRYLLGASPRRERLHSEIYRAMERARRAEPRHPTIEAKVFLCPTGQRFSVYIKPWPGGCGDRDGSHG